MHIIEAGKDRNHYRGAKVKCPTCNCIFEYEREDIEHNSNVWGSADYFYIVCPNEECCTCLMLKDYRFFLFRIFSDRSFKKPKFLQ